MLSAVPETTWLAFKLTEAAACREENTRPEKRPTKSPIHGAAGVDGSSATVTDAAAKAPTIMIPSSATFTMPERSLNRPPRAAMTMGEANIRAMGNISRNSFICGPPPCA